MRIFLVPLSVEGRHLFIYFFISAAYLKLLALGDFDQRPKEPLLPARTVPIWGHFIEGIGCVRGFLGPP